MLFDKLIEHFGTQSAIADFLGVPRVSITQWKEKGTIPAKYVAPLAEETKIPPKELSAYFYNMEVVKRKKK